MEIRCKIKPNSKRGSHIQKINSENGEIFEIFTKNPAIEGKANKEAIEILSKEFKVPKSRISLKRGEKSKLKTFKIDI